MLTLSTLSSVAMGIGDEKMLGMGMKFITVSFSSLNVDMGVQCHARISENSELNGPVIIWMWFIRRCCLHVFFPRCGHADSVHLLMAMLLLLLLLLSVWLSIVVTCDVSNWRRPGGGRCWHLYTDDANDFWLTLRRDGICMPLYIRPPAVCVCVWRHVRDVMQGARLSHAQPAWDHVALAPLLCRPDAAFLRATAGTAIARLSHRNSVRLSVRHTGGSGKNGAS